MTKNTANYISTIAPPFLLLPLVLMWLTRRKVGVENAWPTQAAIQFVPYFN